MIMIMIEIQHSGTALLLLVNPIPHQNDGTAHHGPVSLYQLSSLQAMFNPLYIQQYKSKTV